MTKFDYYQQVFFLFLKKPVPTEILSAYINDEDSDDSYTELADFVGMNLRKEINWSTAIAIIEAVDNIYNEAVGNANIKP